MLSCIHFVKLCSEVISEMFSFVLDCNMKRQENSLPLNACLQVSLNQCVLQSPCRFIHIQNFYHTFHYQKGLWVNSENSSAHSYDCIYEGNFTCNVKWVPSPVESSSVYRQHWQKTYKTETSFKLMEHVL